MQTVVDRRRNDDRRAMLIVMKDRNIHPLAQFGFDLETLRRFNIFQVDATECRLHRRSHLNELLHLIGVQLNIEDIDPSEFLEQDRLAFHHGFRRQWADITQTQNRCPVGDDPDQIRPRGDRCGLCWILNNDLARLGNAGRIRQRQIALIRHRLGCRYFQLSGRRPTVIIECVLNEIVCHVELPSQLVLLLFATPPRAQTFRVRLYRRRG